MAEKKTKKIPIDLYTKLEQFAHGERDAEDVQKSLQEFFEYRRQKDYEHLLYTTSLTSPNPEVRKLAKEAYCDEKGIPKSFRW